MWTNVFKIVCSYPILVAFYHLKANFVLWMRSSKDAPFSGRRELGGTDPDSTMSARRFLPLTN